MIAYRKRKEERQFERVLFSLEENVVGVFNFLWNNKEFISFAASILNLSAGGLQFILRRDDDNGVRVGDRLLLQKIKGNEKLTFCANMELEIRWIIDVQYLEHIGVGCRFQNISDTLREKIGQFIDGAS